MIDILKNTFVHIPGISQNAEQKLWQEKISDWKSFVNNVHNINLSENRKQTAQKFIQQSITAYDQQQFKFFNDCLPGKEQWRAYPDLNGKCGFLDIETTGLSKHRNKVTVIGISDGKKTKVFVNGDNLDEFENEMNKYEMLVTFNGKCFDVPFLKHKFPTTDFDKMHVDLRFVMKTLGYSGGLKNIEKEVGINRDDDLAEVDGYEAVRLWKRYERGDKAALDLLIKYNIADVDNLKTLMDFTFKKLKTQKFGQFIN
ncbi:exonuclease [Candidatus Woesearchaeota archaeon]|nr:exonuclease [Candidatus Woesearchaeota archaeon]